VWEFSTDVRDNPVDDFERRGLSLDYIGPMAAETRGKKDGNEDSCETHVSVPWKTRVYLD
jgi:hypothetical protein